MPLTFGLICEGATDQVVIENILFGLFDDPDLVVKPLQPKPNEPGNWHKVFEYCCSAEFKSALAYNDFLIVQLDTDVLLKEKIPDRFRVAVSEKLSPEEIVARVGEKLISLIDNESGFWAAYGEKVIFGISVHEIECWLLPLYFQNQPKTATKIIGCTKALNTVLNEREGFFIHAKEPKNYAKVAKHFRKQIHKVYTLNPSLKIFVEQVRLKTALPES